MNASRQEAMISVPSSSGKSLQPPNETITGAENYISVPSSSGKSLQPPILSSRAQREYRISVPSSSGKSLQPSSRLQIESLSSIFQSPLHRGNHFNPSWACDEVFCVRISVPSSSGKSLQPSGA